MSVERSTIPSDLVAMLDLLAETIVQALGFGVAAVNLVRADGSIEVVSVAGSDAAREALVGTVVSPEVWDDLLASSEEWGRLRFLDHRTSTYDSFVWVPDIAPLDVSDAWHPEDSLFAPLIAEDGTRLGILSVDVPQDGRRPSPATRRALEAFAVSVALAIEHATMRQRAEDSEVALKHQATHDPLTGLANRALLLDRLRHVLTARFGSESQMALAFVDVDHFKAINDQHSHAVGDEVLTTTAHRIRAAVRPHDTVARWGGDEFLVLLHQLPDERTVLDVVRRISAAIAQPVTVGAQVVEPTASIGVCLWRTGEAGLEVDELIRRADLAMYDSKDAGRDGYAVFDPTSQVDQRRLRLLDLFSRAVAEDRVVLHYQPIVRTEDARIVGVEALLRLRDDDDTLLHPPDFLELAHETGQLPALEHEVIHQACAQVSRWNQDGHDLRLAVNVCAQQMIRITDFEDTVSSALEQSALAPASLVFELTEHALVSLGDATVDGMNRLITRGIRFSVDDFGTGYGSLTYVHDLPLHELKVDRAFVARSAQGSSRAILRSIATLAAELGMNCIAEGVETTEHQDAVRDAGIPEAQGWLYARALEAGDLERLLTS